MDTFDTDKFKKYFKNNTRIHNARNNMSYRPNAGI